MKKFREKTKNMRKGLISFVLALSIVIQTLVIGMISATLAAAVDETPAVGGTSAKVNNVFTESGISYVTSKELTYQGDRTYKLSLMATSSLREAHQTEVRTSSEDGYFTVSAAGTGFYLLELYGGDGGDGKAQQRGGEGVGGQGGYVYGYIYLQEGDTLIYTIGTKGESWVRAGEDGSGENNEDAGHGENGSCEVGAGGGYSAIYLVPADQQNADGTLGYQKPAEGFVTEEYRLNNYIMIAGGGGGGGAGNGPLDPYTGNADGGAGGTAAYDAGIHLTSAENAANGGVSGTYFSGSDGDTSGYKIWAVFGYIDQTKYDYTGRGGTNVPGESISTRFDILDLRETSLAQYWYEGGAGGGGNYRGGGGGAGFAGASGGIMEGALFSRNVGGGGGGSSFVSDAVTAFDLDKVDEDIKDFLLGPGGNDNPTGSGGKAVITFIGADPTTAAFTDHLKDVEINGDISKYFDVVSVNVNNGDFSDKVSHSETVNADGTTSIRVEHANITPDNDGFIDADNYCQVDIFIKAKSDFFGGNKVPILKDLDGVFENGDNGPNFTFTTAETLYEYEYDDPITGQHVKGSKPFDNMTFRFAGGKDANSCLDEEYGNYYKYRDWCDFVNVDLNLEASGNSYSYSTKTLPDSIPLTNLYNDSDDYYAKYRGHEKDYPASSYLKAMGTYQVFERDPDNPYALGAEVKAPLNLPKEAKRWLYTVGYYVTPLVNKDNAAIVGPVVEDNTLISDVAIIIVLEAGTIIIGDKDGNGDRTTLNVDKLLSYDSTTGLYKLSVILNGSNKYEPNVPYAYYTYRDYGFDTSASQGDYNSVNNRFTVPVSGWYAIGVRGGQGGDGHGAEASTGSNEKTGGYGAFGDTVTGYVYLNAGDDITWYLGDHHVQYNRNHNDGRCTGDDRQSGSGGQGGEASWIAVQRQGTGAYVPLIIAAGGAGGAGARSRTNNRNDGRDWSDVDGRGHSHQNRNSWISGLTQAPTASAQAPANYNGGNGGRGYNNYNQPGTQPASYMNSDYVKQTLEISGATFGNPSFMDHEDNVNGGYFPVALCNGGKGEGEFKVSGMLISLVYSEKEGVIVGTNWDANNNLTSNVDVNNYYTVQGGYWTAATRGGNNTGLVSNSTSTKGFYDDLEFGIEFDKYFELVSFVFDGKTIESDAFGSGSGLATNTYTVSQARGDKTSVKFTNIDYDGSTYAYITQGSVRWNNTVNFAANLEDLTFDFYLKPADGFVGGNDVPLLLLLGSDLCDANPGTDDHDAEYAGIGITIPNDPYKPGVTRYVEEKDESDYANVAINYDFNSENFATKQGLVLECGAEIDDITELLEEDEKGLVDRFPDVTDEDAWLWDYAVPKTARDVFGDNTIDGSIYKQTAFTLQQQVAPKYHSDKDNNLTLKAVVVDEVGPATSDNIVTVSVERPVRDELEFITVEYYTSIDGFTAVTDDEGNVTGYKAKTEADISGVLTADTGYILPDNITVTVCGFPLSDFTYDKGTGAFTIPASAVIAVFDENVDAHADASDHSIVIKAEAEAKKVELSFVWWDENGVESSQFKDLAAYIKEQTGEDVDISAIVNEINSKGTSKEFKVGDTLTGDEWYELFVALEEQLSDLPNHKAFRWDWGTQDDSPLTNMPGTDTKIAGYITDKTYTVTVHYVEQGNNGHYLIEDENGEEFTTQVTGRYGASEMVTALDIRGWVPVEASKLVTITEGDSGEVITDVYIEYIESAGQLYVYHAKADTGEQLFIEDPISITYNEIGSYITVPVTVQDVPHYTAKYNGAEVIDSITVEITEADIENGKAVYIYYYPDQYKVIFDGNSTEDDVVFKATDKTERTVEYNNSFGYDADDAKTVQFPQPERKGYTFLGWFTEPADDSGEKIVESVMITEKNKDLEDLGIQTYEPKDGEPIRLYAHWKVSEYSVIVNYTVLDKDDNPIDVGSTYWPAELPDSREVTPVEYKANYEIGIPTPVGFEQFGDITRADGLAVEYSTDGTKLTGQMLLSNVVYNITYKQLTYTLTVNFAWDPTMDTTGLPDLPTSIVKDGDDKLVYNEDYSFTRAELEGGALNEALAEYKLYVLDENGKQVSINDVLSGKMPASDTVITVYYTESFVETVDISLYNFYFDLENVEYNAGTHNYEGSTLEKAFADDYYNINVAVNSKNNKTVSFKYESKEDYKDVLIGSFAGINNNHSFDITAGNTDTVKTEFNLKIADGKTVAVSEAEDFMSGKVIVTVSDKEGVDEP